MFTGTRQKVSVLPSVSDICIDGHKIERVSSYKFLGVHVDESLSWDTHISKISKKGSAWCSQEAKANMSPLNSCEYL